MIYSSNGSLDQWPYEAVVKPASPAGCRILYTLLFLTYFEVEIFYMPFAMASEDPLYVNKWTKFWILYWNLRPQPNQQYTRAAFICNSFKDRLFLVMGEAYQIRDQEIEHDEIVIPRDEYRGEISFNLWKTILTDEVPYNFTFQVLGWAVVFSKKVYRDFILENLAYCRREKGIFLFSYVVLTNHLHIIHQGLGFICDTSSGSASFAMDFPIDTEINFGHGAHAATE